MVLQATVMMLQSKKMDSCTFCSFFADNAHEVEYITEDEVDKVVNLIKPLD